MLTTAAPIPDPNALALHTEINGERVQNGHTSDMIFTVPELIAFLSGSTTLLPGTAIFIGTPEGVGIAANPPRWLQPGHRVDVTIEGIGTPSAIQCWLSQGLSAIVAPVVLTASGSTPDGYQYHQDWPGKSCTTQLIRAKINV